MRQFPAIIKFSTQRQVINASDYLALTREFIDNSDLDDEELVNQLLGVSYPLNDKYAKLSKFDFNLDIPKQLRHKTKVEEVQRKLDELTDAFKKNKMFLSTFDSKKPLQVADIIISVDKDEQGNFIYTIKLTSIPYTVLDKKTLPRGWDEYLLIDGDQTEKVKKGFTTNTWSYVQGDSIAVEEYQKI